MKFLVDTNVVSELRKGDRAHFNVLRWIADVPAQDISTSVLAEIRRGIEGKRRVDPRQARALDRWFRQMRAEFGDRVVPVDEAIAEEWARLNVPDPLPLVDGLLAATAKVRGLTLVTRDTRDVARTGVAMIDPFAKG